MTAITSSQIVIAGLGWEPDGVPATGQAHCAACGADIQPGGLRNPLSLGSAFMDDLSLADRQSSHICGWCAPLFSAQALIDTSHGVFSRDGKRGFRQWADILFSLVSPPEPPFVMLYATANNQHMAWRAPVNHSADLYYVRVGLRDLRIRRRVLGPAVKAVIRLGAAARIEKSQTAAPTPTPEEVLAGMAWLADFPLEQPDDYTALAEAMKIAEKGRRMLPHPFIYGSGSSKKDDGGLSSGLKSGGFGKMVRAAVKLRADTAFAEDFTLINTLSLGETWALQFLLRLYDPADRLSAKPASKTADDQSL